MRHSLVLLLAIFVLIIGAPPAQAAGLPAVLVQYLDLSLAQQQAIIANVNRFDDYVSVKYDEWYTLSDQLDELATADPLDPAKLGEKYAAMIQIDRDVAKFEQEIIALNRAVLREDQERKMQALETAYRLIPTYYAAYYYELAPLTASTPDPVTISVPQSGRKLSVKPSPWVERAAKRAATKPPAR